MPASEVAFERELALFASIGSSLLVRHIAGTHNDSGHRIGFVDEEHTQVTYPLQNY